MSRPYNVSEYAKKSDIETEITEIEIKLTQIISNICKYIAPDYTKATVPTSPYTPLSYGWLHYEGSGDGQMLITDVATGKQLAKKIAGNYGGRSWSGMVYLEKGRKYSFNGTAFVFYPCVGGI